MLAPNKQFSAMCDYLRAFFNGDYERTGLMLPVREFLLDFLTVCSASQRGLVSVLQYQFVFWMYDVVVYSEASMKRAKPSRMLDHTCILAFFIVIPGAPTCYIGKKSSHEELYKWLSCHGRSLLQFWMGRDFADLPDWIEIVEPLVFHSLRRRILDMYDCLLRPETSHLHIINQLLANWPKSSRDGYIAKYLGQQLTLKMRASLKAFASYSLPPHQFPALHSFLIR